MFGGLRSVRASAPEFVGSNARVAEWLGSGLQIRVRGFESLHGLQGRLAER